ncbi:replication initiation protein [Dankookia sp. GCM10030260]|uniref:replication initiation protein n=1 Tax=Dankookia sp. GCM10030260 TaxID=3273390 RepID=UPI003612101A
MSGSADEQAWRHSFEATYAAASQQKQQCRQRRRNQTREPSAETIAAQAARLAAARARIEICFAKAQPTSDLAKIWPFITFQAKAGDPDARLLWRADAEPIFAELRRTRHAAQREEVRLRLSLGYRWLGGPIGGNPAYARVPFVYRGLVSDEHPILKLFVASTPRAALLRTGDTKANVDRVGQKLLALDSPYVAGNKAMCRILRVDIDRDFPGGFAELKDAIAACGVPLPNIAVGHLDPTGRLLHPHLIWLLENAVVLTKKGRQAPKRLYQGVLNALNAALLPIGADPNGRANALHVKNPLCPAWSHAVLAGVPYSLGPDARGPQADAGLPALSPSLDLANAWTRLQAAANDGWHASPTPDHPDPAIAGQSNVLFHTLRVMARAQVGRHRDEGHGSEASFGNAVLAEALRLAQAGLATEEQAAATARSVVRWTWHHYHRSARSPCASPEERRDRQAAGQAKGAASRRAATLAACIVAARDLQGRGQSMTRASVAAAVKRDPRTIRHHWPAVLGALQVPSPEAAIQVAIDKKQSAQEAPGDPSAWLTPATANREPLAPGLLTSCAEAFSVLGECGRTTLPVDARRSAAQGGESAPEATSASFRSDPVSASATKRPRRRSPPPAWKTAIRAGYEAGQRVGELADRFKVDPSSICNAAKRHGWSRPESCVRGGYTTASADVQDAIRVGYEAGHSVEALAQASGVAAGNIYQTARRLEWCRQDQRSRHRTSASLRALAPG